MTEKIVQIKYPTVHIHYLNIETNDWNPNEMTDEEYENLVFGIRKNKGCDDPILVVPIGGTSEDEDEQKYRIVDGAHRYNACIECGFFEIPCVVHSEEEWQDIILQQNETIRRQTIKGKFNKDKFSRLSDSIMQKQNLTRKALASNMGFRNEAHFLENYKSKKEDMENTISNYREEKRKKEEEIKSETKYDGNSDLIYVLETIIEESGDTLDKNYMFFSYEDGNHMYIKADDRLREQLDNLLEYSIKNNVNMSDFMSECIKNKIRGSIN